MAELADEGLLEQPHTSAGRVPTARAFRMYVEQLSGGANPQDRRGSAAGTVADRRLTRVLQGIAGTQAVLERTSPCAGDAVERRGRRDCRGGGGRHAGACTFFAAGAARVLAVVVTQSGAGARPGAGAG